MKVLAFFITIISTLNSTLFAQCGTILPQLGNDTVLCQGQNLTLNPGSFNAYLWDNGATTPTRTVSQTGNYWVKVGTLNLTDNLIVNGDFEQGNVGFTTGYTYTTTSTGSWGMLSQEGYYTITTSPNLAHSNFSSCQDHTPAPGDKMMVVNCANTPTNVWCQTVAINPNTDYYFGTWVANALNDNNVAQLQFTINNQTIGSIFSPSTTGCNWSQFFQIWNSGTMSTANICIRNQNTNIAGNDFMIDDITFTSICYETDTIHVTSIQNPVISVTPNDTICKGDYSSIVASSSNTNLTYTWMPGNIHSNELAVSPTTNTTYTVKAVDTNGCLSNIETRTITVLPTPIVDIIELESTVCYGNPVFLTASSPQNNLTYLWQPTGATTQQIQDTPTHTTTYSVTVTSPNGCIGKDSIEIVVIPALKLNFTGTTTICQGESTTITVNSNFPATNYVWENGNTTNQLTVTPSTSGYYNVKGTYQNCSSVEDSVLITVQPLPTGTIPAIAKVCKGKTITVDITTDPAYSITHWNVQNQTVGNHFVFQATECGYLSYYIENNGCISALDSVYIEVIAACSVEVPNVFTPNNDGINDVFKLISNEGFEQLSCYILNRWGAVIRSFDQANFEWDGKDKAGNKMMEGVYFYIIKGQFNGGEPIEKQGFVTLER